MTEVIIRSAYTKGILVFPTIVILKQALEVMSYSVLRGKSTKIKKVLSDEPTFFTTQNFNTTYKA